MTHRRVFFCQDEKNARLGVKECVEHKLLEPYPVIYERDG
jgi:hypothetical protein